MASEEVVMQALRWLLCFWWLLLVIGCCESPRCRARQQQFLGGGEDVIAVDLPFAAGYRSLCTQGAWGQTSHRARSTNYDVDLDTPNNDEVEIYAPASGIAYTHYRATGFGNHVNLDLGDGTYLIAAHLDDMVVASGAEVAKGQLLGVECSTGASTGDHVHFGRHRGNASQDGIYGTSIEGLELLMRDTAINSSVTLNTTEMICGLSGGRTYESQLPVARWHPEGSLLKLPHDPTVYLVQEHTLRAFPDEDSFLSRGYDFTQVVVMGSEELACYDDGEVFEGSQTLIPVYSTGSLAGVWLLVNDDQGNPEYRLKVPDGAWKEVLATYGLIGYSDTAALMQDPEAVLAKQYRYQGEASFREGSIMKIVGQSALYVMGHGVAMPVKTWDAYLLMGFWPARTIHEVSALAFDQGTEKAGDCSTEASCLSSDDVWSCEGPPDLLALKQERYLRLTWQMPGGVIADKITLSGEVTHLQREQEWYTYAVQQNASAIVTDIPALAGDSFRFSVEYEDNGVRSWSCLGVYPPGTVQGSVLAEFAGEFLGYEMVDDPTSDGCGLRIEIPN